MRSLNGGSAGARGALLVAALLVAGCISQSYAKGRGGSAGAGGPGGGTAGAAGAGGPGGGTAGAAGGPAGAGGSFLETITTESPLFTPKLSAGFSYGRGSASNPGLGGFFHAALAPWVTERVTGYLEFGYRAYRDASYLEFTAAPSFDVWQIWSNAASATAIELSPVLGAAMGTFDRCPQCGGKHIQPLAGGEVGVWWTWRIRDKSMRDSRIANEMKDLADAYRLRCIEMDGAGGNKQDCKELNEKIQIRREQLSDPQGDKDCDFKSPAGGEITTIYLAEIDRCQSAVEDRRATSDDRVKVGLTLRPLYIGGRGLPHLFALDLALGVAF